MDKANRMLHITHISALVCIAVSILIASIAFAFTAAKQPSAKEYPVFLNKTEAAEYLGISAADFDRLVKAEDEAKTAQENTGGTRNALAVRTVTVEGTTYYQRESLDTLLSENGYHRIVVEEGKIKLS